LIPSHHVVPPTSRQSAYFGPKSMEGSSRRVASRRQRPRACHWGSRLVKALNVSGNNSRQTFARSRRESDASREHCPPFQIRRGHARLGMLDEADPPGYCQPRSRLLSQRGCPNAHGVGGQDALLDGTKLNLYLFGMFPSKPLNTTWSETDNDSCSVPSFSTGFSE
jgi:hypothetical protein